MNRATLARTAALALIGACAPLASAEPWLSFKWGHGNSHGRNRHVVVQRGPDIHRGHKAPVFARRYETVPCELQFAAYQSGDTVIITARGANRTAGYCTELVSCDLNDRHPTLTLRNTSPADECAAQVMTPFSLTASIRNRHTLRCITVEVAGERFEVPVIQAQCLS